MSKALVNSEVVKNTITLMRHGRPLLDDTGWIAAAAMAGWIARYNGAAIAPDPIPPQALALAAAARLVATSTLARATSSVAALGRQADIVDAVFGEAELPHARWTLLKLPPQCWAVTFRLAWRCGYTRNAASYRDSRQRAVAATERLTALALQGPILLVGHGIFNRLIAAELTDRGWRSAAPQDSAYWSAATFAPAQLR